MTGNERLLLLDTCGETAGAALSLGQRLLVMEDLERGSASAGIVSVICRLLLNAGWKLSELDAVGVVSGPGSFTGMRVGLATAKGLCEAAGKPLLAVSRLEVLAQAESMQDGFAALDAGRGDLYVRDVRSGCEWLSSIDSFMVLVREKQNSLNTNEAIESIVIAEDRLTERLACATILHPLHVSDALIVMLQRLRESGGDLSQNFQADANYLRQESDIYGKPTVTARLARAEA